MKKIIIGAVVAVAAVTALGLRAQPEATSRVAENIEQKAKAPHADVEDYCIELASSMYAAANALKRGASEEQILDVAKTSSDPVTMKAVRYVLTVGAPPDAARSMVYTKCKIGDFGAVQ